MSATTFSETSTRQASRSHSAERTFWRGFIGLLGATTVAICVVYLIGAVQFVQRPFPGMMVSRTMTVNLAMPAGGSTWTARDAGVQGGDFITAFNGNDLFSGNPANYDYSTARSRYFNLLGGLSAGETVTLDFIRPNYTQQVSYCTPLADGSAECSLSFALMAMPEVDFLFYFGLSFGTGVLITLLGVVVFRWRSNRAEGLIAATIMFLSAIYTAGVFDVGTTALMTPLWIMAAAWLGGAIVTLGLVFPKRLAVVRDLDWLPYAPLVIATLIGIYLVYEYLTPATPWDGGYTQLASLTGTIGLLMLIGLLLVQRERAADPISRDQSNSLFLGVSLMLVPTTFWITGRILITQTSTTFINGEAMMVFYLFPNIAIAYAILQYRRVDTDKIISQSITYTILLTALIVSMSLLAIGGSLFALEILDTDNVILISLVIFGMVTLLTPARNTLQERIDALYFRKRRNYQTKVEDFSRRLAALTDYDDVVREFRQVLDENIAPKTVFIYLQERDGEPYSAYHINGSSTATDVRFSPDSDMITLLQEMGETLSLQPGQTWSAQLWADRNRLQLLNTRLIAPIEGSEKLNGFVIITPPQGAQDIYTHDEVRFVDNLTSQFSIATERSQVIESLEQRVSELDVLSQVGQAVNFTIEFDDLLELIYAQTSKLVDAPNFYIALYEDRIDKMYFAFFLEDEERYNSKEEVRWELDDDLFSEVVKSGNPMRVNDFQQEMQKRGAELTLVSENLRGWIATPLTAGRGTLGVMAAGKSRTGSAYTNEQFKILRDVGALAATSLDKANLFNQTKLRERQLTVLNEISRELVATESDVEQLLEIIMNSSVEILNAEAGSLLLDTEDDAEKLEFRVVIGGAGEELLGKRMGRDEGIVGQVVQTGEPMIVNDTKKEARHMQEMAANYDSRSLLAVPLIAKDGVIGVIEVLNKTDGTPFLEEDADLLTTFAGQAAVAIENARLFQMTDRQLAQRVEELETLERIDNRLNRTLQLREVANITVESTMDVLEADAGALGIVHESPPWLEIVAIKGYTEDEYPDGAEGLRWLLEEGIIGRVYDSRRPDLTVNMEEGPDYDGKLTGSNSQITVPMMSGDDINAILILEKNTQPRFSLPDWSFAQRIAEHASIAIANAQFYAALMRADKSKSEFMGFAAHELKNPLSSVTGYADVLKTGMLGDLSEKQQEFIQVIHSNAERMKTIINDLRDAARQDAGEFQVDAEPMNVHHAVVETLRPYVRVLEDKDQEVVNDVPEDLPLVMGDENRLIQVLTNLVSNAHKYSPAGTKIRVYAEYIDEYVDKRNKRRGPMVMIAVEDEGLGISEEDQQRLFRERYFRSTNPEALDQPGTGLGMMLTQGIINQHDGEIWVDSTLGEGSTFKLVIPVVDQDKLQADDEEMPEPSTEPASD